jgi:hypothetical protein
MHQHKYYDSYPMPNCYEISSMIMKIEGPGIARPIQQLGYGAGRLTSQNPSPGKGKGFSLLRNVQTYSEAYLAS